MPTLNKLIIIIVIIASHCVFVARIYYYETRQIIDLWKPTTPDYLLAHGGFPARVLVSSRASPFSLTHQHSPTEGWHCTSENLPSVSHIGTNAPGAGTTCPSITNAFFKASLRLFWHSLKTCSFEIKKKQSIIKELQNLSLSLSLSLKLSPELSLELSKALDLSFSLKLSLSKALFLSLELYLELSLSLLSLFSCKPSFY